MLLRKNARIVKSSFGKIYGLAAVPAMLYYTVQKTSTVEYMPLLF